MLQVKNLSYRYPGNSSYTIRNLNFAIGKGEIFGFLGPSGSGKSTTQKILYKLLKGYEGAIFFEDQNLLEWEHGFYEKIGVSFELPNHYLKLSAYENLHFFSSFYKSKGNIPELLEKVGLLQDSHKKVSEFSKGMKMRLNFIRSLLHNPEMIFLDEPTSGLDPLNAKIIKDMILDLKNSGKTIFITTHNMFDADQICDRVALLANGEIKALEKPQELKQRFGKRKVKVTVKGSNNEQVFDLENLASNEVFLNIIQTNSLNTIHSEEASLEEVFIQLTGTRLV